MACQAWRGLIGGIVAALLLAPISATSAQTDPQPGSGAAKPAKTAAKKTEPSKKTAAAKPKTPAKKVAAAAKKTEPTKRTVTVAKPAAEPAKTAVAKPAAEPSKTAATAESQPQQPSYTVTTTRNNITYTATRVVPLPAAAALPVSKAAAVPVHPTPAVHQPTPQMAAVVTSDKSATDKVANVVPERPTVSQTAPVQAGSKDAAIGFVSNFLGEAFRIAKLKGATSLQRRAQLAELFSSKMDVKRIAGYTTGNELNGLSSDLQQRFRTILVSYLVETYYPRLELASDPSVHVETASTEPPSGGKAVVWTTFTKDGWGSQSVKWQLAIEDGGYKIVDIFSAGASLVQMERDTFLSVMRDGGLNQLMAKLDARTKELATAAQ